MLEMERELLVSLEELLEFLSQYDSMLYECDISYELNVEDVALRMKFNEDFLDTAVSDRVLKEILHPYEAFLPYNVEETVSASIVLIDRIAYAIFKIV